MWMLTNLHHLLTTCTCDALSVNTNGMKQSLNSIQRCLSHVFLLEQQKNYRCGRNLKHKQWCGPMIGGTCSRWTILRIGEEEKQQYKVSHPCFDDHQFTQEELKTVGELQKVCSQIVVKCLYLARIGRPDILWSVKNGLSEADFLCSSHEWLSSMLSCGEHDTTLQIWTVSRLRFCRRPWRLKINLKRCLVHFGKQNICPSQLDVQEANFSFAQLYRIWSKFVGCWITYGWVTCCWSLGPRDWSFTFNERQNSTQTYWPSRNWGSTILHTEYTPVACIMNNFSLLTSTDHTCASGSRFKSLTAQDCSVIIVRMKIGQSSGQPCHLLAGLFHTFSLPVHHNTKHHQDSTTFSMTSTSSRTYTVYKHRWWTAFTHKLREWQKPAQHLSHRLWAQRACDNFRKFSGTSIKERCTERIWRTWSRSSNYWRSEGFWCVTICLDTKFTRSWDGRDVTCWEDVLPAVPDAHRRAALFSPKRNEQRNQNWCSVFGNANVTQDYLLNHSRSASVIHKNERRRKAGHHRTYKTNLLNLIENKFDYKRSYNERRKLFVIRKFEVSTKWQ